MNPPTPQTEQEDQARMDSFRKEPFWTGWRAYFRERFPLPLYTVLIASFYLANHCLAQACERPGGPISIDQWSLAGWVTLFCLFFQLRVFDDDKDYTNDCQFFPERALQRGAVTRRQLFRLAAIASLTALVLAGLAGLPQLSATVIALGFSLLMWREFFARSWLRQQFLFSALSHLLVMPLLALVVYSFATGNYPWQANFRFLCYAALGYSLAFTAEISRKVRAAEDERRGVNTYTLVLGIPSATALLAGLVGFQVLVAGLLGSILGVGLGFYLSLGLLACGYGAFVLGFRSRPTRAAAKSVQTSSGLYLLGFDLIWIVTLALQSGLRWQ